MKTNWIKQGAIVMGIGGVFFVGSALALTIQDTPMTFGDVPFTLYCAFTMAEVTGLAFIGKGIWDKIKKGG